MKDLVLSRYLENETLGEQGEEEASIRNWENVTLEKRKNENSEETQEVKKDNFS